MYQKLVSLPRKSKRAVLYAVDLLMIVLAILLAFSLRYGSPNPMPLVASAFDVLLVVVAFGALMISLFGLHRVKLHNITIGTIGQIGLVAVLLSIVAMAASYLLKAPTPRSVPIIFGATFFFLSVGSRILMLGVLLFLRGRSNNVRPVFIYGAGATGIQIASALRASGDNVPVAFLDDNYTMQNLRIAGLQVYPPSALEDLIKKHGKGKLVLALPSLSLARRQEILRSMRKYDVDIQMLRSHAQMLESGSLADSLSSVKPDDLLGRDKVDLNVPEVSKAYAGRSVMVTGAGGSIGSELCRQLADCAPRRIVLFEHSEFALYQIDQELRTILPDHAGIEIRSYLGSITNAARVRDVMEKNKVEIVLHAAAYKHVPIVEDNEVEGARNNVVGTRTVAQAACDAGVERFILVSTDKAVRPTNIMGATKRMAELVTQELQDRTSNTKLAMVRFGNVLGSSGSVLPLFQRQIESGGPVTVTHPDVTRFFMTIPEAARLVLLAGAFSEGGDVFVLDMGEPMKVIDIARRMIELAGQKVKEEGDETGIAINIVGLRPGEKLYEELLIDDSSLRPTPHGKILRAEESKLSEIEIVAMLKKLGAGIEAGDADHIRRVAKEYVSGYTRPTVDAQAQLTS